MKPKLFLTVVLSTTTISTGILLGAVSSAQACALSKSDYDQQTAEPTNWSNSPWAAMITLPGIAIAAALSLGDRYYRG